MRLPILSILALAAAPVAAATQPADPGQPACPRMGVENVATPGKSVTIHPLDQEPPADRIVAVLHTEGGCVKPIVVDRMVGAPADLPPRQTSSTRRP